MKRFTAVFSTFLALTLAMPAVAKASTPTVPGAVGTVSTSVKSPTAITLSWTAPSDTGNLAIDAYQIQMRALGGSWVAIPNPPNGPSFVPGSQTSLRIFGLTRGVSYHFRVAASNALGDGPFVETIQSHLMAVVPPAPVDVRVSGSPSSSPYQTTSRTISWNVLDNGGSTISDFRIQHSSDGLTWTTFSDGVSPSLSAVVSGLTRGVRYTFRVAAINTEGVGQYSKSRVFNAGENHNCELRQGMSYCWGLNDRLQLGQSTSPNTATAQRILVPGLSTAVDLSAGRHHTCALLIDSTVACWGNNVQGQLGRGGTASDVNFSPPNIKVVERVSNQALSGVVQLSSGLLHLCALTKDAVVYCWGSRTSGQVAGDSITAAGATTALMAPTLRDVKQISAGGSHSCALTYSGTVFCWGNNLDGQLGDGSKVNTSTPVQVQGLSNVEQVSAGAQHTCAVLGTSEVRCWGQNSSGQLGNGTQTSSVTPVAPAGLSGVTDVYAVDHRTCARNVDGLFCWGSNFRGKIGNGVNGATGSVVLQPYLVSEVTNSDFSGGWDHSCAVSPTGLLKCWGSNGTFQIDASGSTQVRPIDVPYSSDENVSSSRIVVTVPEVPTDVREVSHGETTAQISWTAPIDDGGSAITDYQIQYSSVAGNWINFSDGTSSLTSATISGLTRGVVYNFRVAAVNAIAAGAFSMQSDGSVPGVVPRPVRSLRSLRWNSGFREASLILSWIVPDDGGRGITDYEIQYRPSGTSTWQTFTDGVSTTARAEITGLTRGNAYEARVRAVNIEGSGVWAYLGVEHLEAGGSSACVVSSNGTTNCWGENESGQMGNGSTADSASPTQTTFSTSGYTHVSHGSTHGCGLDTKSAGTIGNVVCWGGNANGQLGPNISVGTRSSTPVQVLSNAFIVSSGGNSSCAVLISGQVRCWGQNSDGQLGNNSNQDSSTPVAVQGIVGAIRVVVGANHACARLSSGGVRCWGKNLNGQLGNNTTVDSWTPVEVSGISTATDIALGGSHTCAVLSGGVVQCWGRNTSGQLGNSTNTQSLVPISVTGVTDGVSVALGASHSCVLTLSSVVRCWGFNASGQLGDASTTSRNAPALVVGLFEIVAIAAGDLFTCASNASSEVKCWGSGSSGQLGNGSFSDSLIGLSVVGVAPSSSTVVKTTPSVPQSLTKTSHGATSVSLSWTAPQGDGGEPISDYQIEYLVFSGGDWVVFNDGVSTATTATITGLTRGVGYLFRVRALNDIGRLSVEMISGTPSATSELIVPAVNPSQVRNITIPNVMATSVNLVWSAPLDDGGRPIIDYLIEHRLVGANWVVFSDSVSTSTILAVTGLSQGQSYEFRISAISENGTGDSAQMAGVGIPATVPDAPVLLNSQTVVSGSSVQISWSAPFSGGRVITDYEVETNSGSGWVLFNDGVSAATSATVTGLTRGTVLRIRVRAVNALGTSSYSHAFQESVSQIAPGRHSCAVGVSGSVWCWGLNSSGQVGDGTTTTRFEMQRVPRISNATKVAVGFDFSCALLSTGEVSCWGANANGQLGNGNTLSAVIPQRVLGVTSAIDIDTGAGFACAALSDNSVKCWGSNAHRQLGDGSTAGNSSTAVVVAGLNGITKVALAASTACALNTAGSVSCWGLNSGLQTGTGVSTTPVVSPMGVKFSSSVFISGMVSVESDYGSNGFCGTTSGGAVNCWGASSNYARGDNSLVASRWAVTTIGSGISKVAVGSEHACALSVSAGGTVRCWGYNVHGQASGGLSRSNVLTPSVSVVSGGATDVVAGEYVSCSKDSTGSISCWGSNSTFGLQNSDSGLTGGPYASDQRRFAVITRDAPSSPTGLQTSQATQNSITVSWAAPSDNGGAALFDYILETSVNGGAWTTIPDGTGTATSYVHSGLNRGANYLYRVAAVNEGDVIGSSATLGTAEFAATPPGQISNLSSSDNDASSVSLSWSAPSDDGGRPVTDYQIEYLPAGGSWTVFSDGVTATASAVVTGLTKGVMYQFRISAVNAEGTGATSSAIGVVPAVVPGAVQSVAKTSHTRNSVGLSWVAPVDNGGQPISDYVIDYRLNNGNWTRFSDGVSTSTNTVVTGLTQGLEYQFRVAAVSVEGEGSVALLGTTVVPRTVPGSPQNLRELSHTGSSVTAAWDSPIDDGGLVITDYVIEYRSVNGSAWTVFEDSVSTNRQITISSLEKGTTYMFRVSAISAEGTGLPSTQFASTNIDVLLPEISWGKVACSVGVSGLVWCSGAAQAGPVLGNGYDRVPIEGVSDAKQVSVGADHTCALLNSGTVKCWGFNGWGQLGNGSMITPSSPVDVVGLNNVVQVEAGQTFTCARKSDGTVWCWGNGDVNRNGTGTTTSTPVRLTSISGATDLSVGDGMGCVVVSGNVRCWGYVANGRLGNPSNASNTNVPQIVRNTSTTSNVTTNYLTSVVEISSSANAGFTCARRSLGTVFCWGDSAVGQVGLSSGFSTFARQISGVTTAQSLGLGTTHACVLASGGSVSCWGWNAAGMIGDGTIGTRITPVTVIGSGATSISAGHLNSSAVVNGRQYIWGDNDFGQQSRPISSSITDDLLSPTEMAPLAMGFVIPATVPGSPVISSETHISTAVTLNWSQPADSGGRIVDDYIVEYKSASSNSWIRFDDGVSKTLTATVTGLTRGLPYDFRIAARNIEGDGPPSSSVSVIPSVVPAAVTSVSVPSYTRTSVDVTWTMPSDNGGQPVTDYRIEFRKNPEVVWTTYLDGVSTDTVATVLGLARGTYSFRISAINANGAGAGTSISGVIPAVVPLAPAITSMFAPVSGGSAVANIAAVDDGGRDIDLMQFRLDGGTWESAPAWTASSVTINGLENGRIYVVDIRARNPEGFGAGSNSLSVIPATTPTAPSITAVDRPIDGLKLSVSFSSASGEGREITTYQYSLNGSVWLNRNDGQTVTSPLLINSGLTNGSLYSVEIRAVNAQGNGQSSNSMSQVPGAIPSAPTITRLEPSNAGMGIVFSVPSSNGGLPISNYEYSTNGGQTWVTRSPSAVTSPWTIAGLQNGVSYTVVLRAVNAQGGGTESNSLAATPAALPSSPTISSISRPTAGGMLDVEFVAPNSDGGAAITKYQYSLNGGASWMERTDAAGPTVSPMRILGLTNGSSYQITIRAANAQGSGVSSQIFTAVPATIPSAPAISSFTTPTVGGEVDVSFSAALSNGASITGHEYSVNNGVTWQGRTDGYTTETPMTIDGLTNGTTYLIRIRAVNAQGSGQPSNAIAATPATIPGRASIASLEYGESRIFVNVTAPGNGGSAITSYAYSIDGEETWYDTNSSSTSFSIGGLVNGRTYPVAVSAENRQGYGESSGVSYVTIGAQPNAITTGAADVTASTVRLEGQVSANFVPTTTEFQLSTTSNFSSIYKTVAGFPLSGAALTSIAVDVSDIVESTTYFYRIVARNSLGVSFGSVLSFRTNGPLGITANNGSIYTNSTNVSMGVSWPRGSTAVILSNDGGFGVSSRFSLSELIPWTLQSSGNERLPKTVYARFVLADGSRSSTYTDDIILDETAPVLQDVISSSYEGDTVSVASLSKRMLSVRASDGNSGVARFELRSSAVAPSVFVSASNPEATQHSVAVTSGSSVIEVRVFDRAGNASGWKPVTLNSSASGSATATPSASKPTVTASVKLSGTTARVSVKLPSTMAKTCATKVVKGKKTSVCTPATIAVSVSGGGSKTVKAKAGSNAITVPKAKKGATVTIRVNGKVVQRIKM